MAMQIELARSGVYIENCWMNILKKQITIQEMARRIKEITPDMCVMTTDLGQAENISPPEGLLLFCKRLFDFSFTDDEIKRMICENPQNMLCVTNI
jgi:hypothetical protein